MKGGQRGFVQLLECCSAGCAQAYGLWWYFRLAISHLETNSETHPTPVFAIQLSSCKFGFIQK